MLKLDNVGRGLGERREGGGMEGRGGRKEGGSKGDSHWRVSRTHFMSVTSEMSQQQMLPLYVMVAVTLFAIQAATAVSKVVSLS